MIELVPLNQENRSDIYQLIRNNPGVHFREICKKLDKQFGVVQYHVDVLTRAGLIFSKKEGRYLHFFSSEHDSEDKKIVVQCYLQRTTARTILVHLALHGRTAHSDLVITCGVTSQAITFCVKKLVKHDLITESKEGRQKYYELSVKPLDVLEMMEEVE